MLHKVHWSHECAFELNPVTKGIKCSHLNETKGSISGGWEDGEPKMCGAWLLKSQKADLELEPDKQWLSANL